MGRGKTRQYMTDCVFIFFKYKRFRILGNVGSNTILKSINNFIQVKVLPGIRALK